MTKIILIDDDALVIQALETILNVQPNLEVVATGNDGDDALPLYKEHQPDILLMDIRMANKTGLDGAREVLTFDTDANILFLTTFQDDEYINQALAIGCAGYILKQNIKGLIPAIDAVINGQTVLDSQIIPLLRPAQEMIAVPDLSEREQQIITLVADGLNNKEIAETMFLSEGTVRNYLSELLEKLELRDRTQLAIYYYKHISK